MITVLFRFLQLIWQNLVLCKVVTKWFHSNGQEFNRPCALSPEQWESSSAESPSTKRRRETEREMSLLRFKQFYHASVQQWAENTGCKCIDTYVGPNVCVCVCVLSSMTFVCPSTEASWFRRRFVFTVFSVVASGVARNLIEGGYNTIWVYKSYITLKILKNHWKL